MGTKTDRRVRRTRNAINTAFMELITEKGFDRITIHDLSERADVNRGTFYLHFMDKYDLLDQYIEDHLNSMMNSCTFSRFTKETVGKVEAVEALKSLFIYFEGNISFFSAMLDCNNISAFRKQLLELVSSALSKKIDGGVANQHMDKKLMVHFLASAFVGIVEDWILNDMPHSPQYMAEQIWAVFERNHVKP